MTKPFTNAQVVRLRKAAAKGASSEDLAERFKVHRSTITNVISGRTHTDVGGTTQGKSKGKRRGPKKGRKKGRSVRARRVKSKQSRISPSDLTSQIRDLTELPANELLRLVQALGQEWGKIREFFLTIDRIITGNEDQ